MQRRDFRGNIEQKYQAISQHRYTSRDCVSNLNRSLKDLDAEDCSNSRIPVYSNGSGNNFQDSKLSPINKNPNKSISISLVESMSNTQNINNVRIGLQNWLYN